MSRRRALPAKSHNLCELAHMTTKKMHPNATLPVHGGDRAAIAKLLTERHADVRRYAFRHCQIGAVEEMVQEKLLAVSRKIKGVRAISAFSSRIFTVLKRECHKLERKISRHERVEEEQLEQWISASSEEALRSDLGTALARLPDHYLEILLLRDFEQWTIAEIAEHTGDPAEVMKIRLRQARQLVRDYLITAATPTFRSLSPA